MTAGAPSQSNLQALASDRDAMIANVFGELSPKAYKKVNELLNQCIGERNGSITQGGVYGNVESFIQYIVKMLQELATGKKFEDANKEASNFSANAGIQMGAATLCFKLKEAGRMDPDYAILGERAERFTGMYQKRSDGNTYLPEQEDPNTVTARLRAAQGLSTYAPDKFGSLNLRETQRDAPEIVRVAAIGNYPAIDTTSVSNPLPTPPGTVPVPQLK